MPTGRTPPRRAEYMPMAVPHYYSADMVRSLPDDGNRYETVRGELLVTPAPRLLHQRVVLRLARLPRGLRRAARAWARRLPPRRTSPGATTSSSSRTCLVVAIDEARTLDWARIKSLLLAVEVLSPSSTRADRFTKRRLYQEVGVPLYWVVDADQQAGRGLGAAGDIPSVRTGAPRLASGRRFPARSTFHSPNSSGRSESRPFAAVRTYLFPRVRCRSSSIQFTTMISCRSCSTGRTMTKLPPSGATS